MKEENTVGKLIIDEKKKGVYKNLISGGISASIARTILNPIERIEMLRQVQNSEYQGLKMSTSLTKIYKTQGILGIFKGNTASILRIFPFAALEFYFYELYKNMFIRGTTNRKNSNFYNFISGGLTGLSAATLTFPLDVARTRLGITTLHSKIKENRISKALINLWKSDGIRGLYKGYGISSIGQFFFIAIKQSLFDLFKNKFINKSNSKKKNLQTLFYGSLAGMIGTIFVYPPYLIKRVLQANNDKNFKLLIFLKERYNKFGLKGFYLGFSMTLIKTVPYIGITFLINEKLKLLLKY